MISKERILHLIRTKGPVIPANISKEIGQNLMMTGAVLAELSSKKEVKVSNLKVGSSPLYYIEGQEGRLQDFSNRLGPHEKVAYNQLREGKILRDRELDVRVRVALRLIKDFAIPLQVTFNQKDEIFWKWYLLANEEAEKRIKIKLGIIKPAEEPVEAAKPKLIERKIIPPIKQRIAPPIKKEAPRLVVERKPIEKVIEKRNIKPAIPERKIKERVEKSITPKVPEEKIERRIRPKILGVKTEKEKIEKPTEIQKELEKPDFYEISNIGFFKNVREFFVRQNIKIKSYEVIRKNTEVEFIISMGSAFGELEYYCKAKSKKRISDSDISNAFVKGQLKKLPVVLLSQGVLTKKADVLLNKDLKGIYFKKI